MVELCRQILEINTLCSNVKKIAKVSFPIVVGLYLCASRSDAQNLVKRFESKIKLLDYEVLKPQYDLVNFVWDHLKLGYAYKNVPNIEDFWSRCLDEYRTRKRFWSWLTIEEIKLYNDFVDVSDLADDGAYMHPTSYEKIKGTPILSTPPTNPIIYIIEVLM